MAIFTTTDRDTVKAALITAATEGIVSVSIGGQQVQAYTLEQLKSLLDVIQADLAAANLNSNCGLRFRKTIPPAGG